MSNPWDSFDDNELSGSRPSDIGQDGLYRLKVLSAFDSYKVNDGDREDPDRNRRINLRVKVLEAIRDERDSDAVELEEDFEARQSEKGNISNISIWLSRDGNASLLQGNMRFLASVAGSPSDDQPDEDLLHEAYTGEGQNGQNQYDLGKIADEMHVNCSSLVGRDFIAEVQDTDSDYPSFFPWYCKQVPDEHQTTFDHPEEGEMTPESGPLFSGTDQASQRMKERFEDDSSSGGAPSKYESVEAKESAEPLGADDEVPF